MAQSIWGLQALIAIQEHTLDRDAFIHAIGSWHKEAKQIDFDEVEAMVCITLACHRFANFLKINLEDEVRKRLTQ